MTVTESERVHIETRMANFMERVNKIDDWEWEYREEGKKSYEVLTGYTEVSGVAWEIKLTKVTHEDHYGGSTVEHRASARKVTHVEPEFDLSDRDMCMYVGYGPFNDAFEKAKEKTGVAYFKQVKDMVFNSEFLG